MKIRQSRSIDAPTIRLARSLFRPAERMEVAGRDWCSLAPAASPAAAAHQQCACALWGRKAHRGIGGCVPPGWGRRGASMKSIDSWGCRKLPQGGAPKSGALVKSMSYDRVPQLGSLGARTIRHLSSPLRPYCSLIICSSLKRRHIARSKSPFVSPSRSVAGFFENNRGA